ncbi:MAG: hypothetical protein IPM54_06650 [Polyangiaceae bacterium]|nr:hypothetical protein [Polyangiaceae bacterium]
MNSAFRGTAWGFATRLWVAIGLAVATGCSSGAYGDLDGNSGGGGSTGGYGGYGGRANADAVVEEGEGVAIRESLDEALALPPPSTAIACTLGSQCPTGYCVDGFCCDNKCDNKCMACSAAKKGSGVDGVCGSVKYDTDPDNDCPLGACDGKNMCKNYNGVACTAAAQCLSNYCVDGYCCNNICMGGCSACSAAKKGSGNNGQCGLIAAATDPDNECNPGECNGSGACSAAQTKQANGTACTGSAQCESGYCADGVCCDSWCLGSCQACTAAKKFSGVDGVCGPIANDKDPDEECWGGACNGSGVCKQYNGVPCANKSQCLSGYCVDGFCCGNLCTQMCYACSEARKGQGYDGVCGPMKSGHDPDSECNPGECNGSGACNQPQTPQANGTTCVSGGQCASGNCVDGVCCDTACASTCMACTAAKKGQGVDGVCGNIGSELDPDLECNGGRCDNKGACRYYNGAPCSNKDQCFSHYCVDGFCCGNICIGACQACSSAKKGGGFDGVCGNVAASTDPDNECNPGECNGGGACNQPQSPQPNGAACTLATQCQSGFCVDGVCCDSACPLLCQACTAAKKGQGLNGTCGNIITGTDPDNECMNSECNGNAGCTSPINLPNGTTCTAGDQCASLHCVDGICCDTACNGICVACSATKKGQGTDGTCGPIKYDTDPDDECYGGGCNGSGACGYYNGVPCSMGDQCLSTYCVDGVCCNNHCGGLCYACTGAKKGTGFDGVCSFIKSNTDPDDECSGVCNGAGVCTTPTCSTSADCGANASCNNSTCECDTGYTGDGYNCTDIDECQTNNGGCDIHATCTNTPGSRTCACNMGYTGDGVTCTDIDECQTNNGGCDPNATCTNTPGSRTCACNAGYTGDGETCTFDGQMTKLWVGYNNACAQADSGNAKCWGSNAAGVLGIGDQNPRGVNPGEMGSNLPLLDLGTGKMATRIGIMTDAACAVLEDASLKCWGSSFWGQLGMGFPTIIGDNPGEMGDNLPVVNLGTGKTVTAIGVGVFNVCAILNDGSVKCWGQNQFGQLGQGHTFNKGHGANDMGDNLLAVDLGIGRTAAAIVGGSNHMCAILDDSTVKCWGSNSSGNLGIGDVNHRGDNAGELGDALPVVDLGTGKTAIAIAAGSNHTCALLNDSSVKCWGNNTAGQLGLGDTSARGNDMGEMGDALPAVDLGVGKTAVSIAAGGDHTCALLNDGSLKCWGENALGQLGLGDVNRRGDSSNEMGDNLAAIDLGTGKTATTVRCGNTHTCVILDDATIKCWGKSDVGQLGLGDAVTRGDGPSEMGDNLPTVSPF